MEKMVLLVLVMSLVLTACFPAGASEAGASQMDASGTGIAEPGASEAGAEEAQAREMPASFDLRSVDTDGDGIGDRCYVTPVRFQNPLSTCWAFAAIAAAETSLLGSVYADDPEAWKTLDLSEKHLGYFSHVPLNDPASPQHGEGLEAVDPTNMFDVYGGGSTVMAAAAFAQGIGPCDEHPKGLDVGDLFEYHGRERVIVQDYIDGAYRPYHYSDEDDWTIPEEYRFHQDYIMKEAHFLPSPARMADAEKNEYNEAGTIAIKEELLKKRGVMISMLADLSTPETETVKAPIYISDKWAHYTWNNGSSNHAVTIIGWDDHYPRENFLAEHQPPADGAWLAKNSWGSAEEAFPSYSRGNWGIENEEGKHTGYFWISYYDRSLCEPVSMELTAASAPESVDQLDYFLPSELNSKTFDEPASMANVFRAKHSETLHAISCMTISENTSAHYRIYLLQNAYETPEDGMMLEEGTVLFEHAGIHRIPVSAFTVMKDQYFSVIVTLTNPEGKWDVVMPMTRGFTEDGRQTAVVNERESFLQQEGQWQDYKPVVDDMISEASEPEMEGLINMGYDSFPIKAYSDRAAADVKMKLTHGDHQLSLLEELDKDLYTLQFIAGSDFRAGNPSIVWQPLPGSEDIAEGAPRDQGARLLLTAKTAGTALFSVTAEGIGTMVFPVTVGEGRIGLILVAAENLPYTGQEITPLVLVFSDTGPIMTEGVHYQVTYADNIRCGLARAEITGIGMCGEREEGATHVEYFTIVPGSPEMASLEAGSGEIRLSVTDLSDTGADGYEAQYRMKGSKEWVTAAFEAGRNDLVISGLQAGEYEIQVRAFVDNTADSVPEEHRKTAYGPYGDIRTVTVP